MRTKTLLLTAAALLAAGIVSSQAQPVYSQNVVGYATTVMPNPSGNILYMAACPFVIGVSNGADEVYGLIANPGNLPKGTTILTWNPVDGPNGSANTYSTAYYDPSYEPAYSGWWDGADEDHNIPAPTLPPGMGFFIQPAGSVTNTFAGTVAVAVGGSATTILTNPSGNILYMVASAIPYAGDVTNVGGINLTNMPNGSTVLVWNSIDNPNGAANTYTTYYWDAQYQPTYGSWWDGADEDHNVADPVLPVGGALFVQPAGTYKWVQSLPSN